MCFFQGKYVNRSFITWTAEKFWVRAEVDTAKGGKDKYENLNNIHNFLKRIFE